MESNPPFLYTYWDTQAFPLKVVILVSKWQDNKYNNKRLYRNIIK